jgi:hypothetical protein
VSALFARRSAAPEAKMDEFISLVTFASPYHQAWFVGSMFLLLASCSAVKLGYRQRFDWLCLMHAVVVIEAILWVCLRPGENKVFSFHCIWFNLLMAGIYFLLIGGREVAEQIAAAEAEAAEQAAEPDDNDAR